MNFSVSTAKFICYLAVRTERFVYFGWVKESVTANPLQTTTRRNMQHSKLR